MSTTIPFIPETAPFSEPQRQWLNGFLQGLYSESEGHQNNTPTIPITILFGSQTGTSESLAKKASKQLSKSNFKATVMDMSSCSIDDLSNIENLLIITSTYGEGEPPDNATDLHQALMAEDAPSMELVNYSVLGLGDSSYPDFCQCSKEFDTRLEALGATRISPMVEVDGDPDELFPTWLQSASASLGNDPGSITELPIEESETTPLFNKKNPYPATLLNTKNLNGIGSSKATHHVELSLQGSDLNYQVGDALGVYPENSAELVEQILKASSLEPNEPVQLEDGTSVTVQEALLYHVDISILTEPFLLSCSRLSKQGKLIELMKSSESVQEYCQGRSILDPVLDFDVTFPTANYLIATLKPLKPRLYSISSSPQLHPDEVHLTVGKVIYESHGRQRLGVCSNYLARHDRQRPVKVFTHPNTNFRLPQDDSAPVIMIGPGTGIAPFRAFLEEREARQAKGKNWLFFGDQHAATDFLYQEQIQAWLDSSLLSDIDTAFSRDQEEKIYVQNRILQKAKEFYTWLEQGAFIYVCGDASRMAKDVDKAIQQVIELVGHQSEQQAQEYISKLKKEKRYQRDVY